MRCLPLFSFLIAIPLTSLHAASNGRPTAGPYQDSHCGATREFITSLEFLRAMTEFKLPDPKSRALARKVTYGCSGAARRFIGWRRRSSKPSCPPKIRSRRPWISRDEPRTRRIHSLPFSKPLFAWVDGFGPSNLTAAGPPRWSRILAVIRLVRGLISSVS